MTSIRAGYLVEVTLFTLNSLEDEYVYIVRETEEVLGRHVSCGISKYLSTKGLISRNHAKLTVEDDILYVEDLDSRNGTYVNGKKIKKKTKLNLGDSLSLGVAGVKWDHNRTGAHFKVAGTVEKILVPDPPDFIKYDEDE